VDVLDRAESLLPELKLGGAVELLEASVEVALERLGLVEVDGVGLVGVLGNVLEVVAEEVAEAAELGLAGVFETELESLVGGSLVESLEASVVAQDIENGTVGLPQELEPRGDNGTISAVLVLLSGNGAEEDGLRGLGGLEIIETVEGDLVSLGLSLLDLLLRQLDELSDHELLTSSSDNAWQESVRDTRHSINVTYQHLHRRPLHILHMLHIPYLDSSDAGVLGDVLVLVETLLGDLALAERDAQLDKLEHDGLEGAQGNTAGALGDDNIMEGLKGSTMLSDGDELYNVGWTRRR